MKQVPFSVVRALILAVSATVISACALGRMPVPPGTVPRQENVPPEDEQYGHDVLSALMERYELETDDQKVNRARDVVDKLSLAAKADQNPWHVYVLKDDNFKNAAATRGNFIFIWSGMFDVVKNDDELATVLSHEIGHVLAGHTMPHPVEEVNRILSGVAGDVAGRIIAQQGGAYSGIVVSLSEMLITEMLQAVLVNPEAQRQELEADHIGMFLMADAGLNPEHAVAFWERVSTDPDFEGFPVAFLSSHPSSYKRVEELRRHLPEAQRRYNGEVPALIQKPDQPLHSPARDKDSWVVVEPFVPVYAAPDASSELLGTLKEGKSVKVKTIQGRWLKIDTPYEGFVKSFLLAPASN
jgi:predicted Zn-dependent protease